MSSLFSSLSIALPSFDSSFKLVGDELTYPLRPQTTKKQEEMLFVRGTWMRQPPFEMDLGSRPANRLCSRTGDSVVLISPQA